MLRQIPFCAVLLLLSVGPVFADASHNGLSTAQAPAGENISEDYELLVGSQNVPVYPCRVSAVPMNQVWPGYQRPMDQTEVASFASWDMAGPVDIEVVSHRPIGSVAIRPTSCGIQAKVEGNRIIFHMAQPRQITVEVDGCRKALHLFANAPQTETPSPQSPGVHYFGPGVHRPGKITLGNNENVYIANGAVVHGWIEAQDASNIRIFGRGILDNSEFERQDRGGCIRLVGCKNVVIDGVILRDPNLWCLNLFGCSAVNIANIKLIGLWRYNADGIDVCNSQDVSIRDCFVRAFDDCIAIKGMSFMGPLPVRNVTVERCTLWNDWGRAIEIGAETAAPEIADITFRDCDILRTTHIALDIQHGDKATIRNILFDRIRVEVDDVNLRPQYQHAKDLKYVQDTNYMPELLVLEIRKNVCSQDAQLGAIEHVIVRDVSVVGHTMPASRIAGFDADHQIRHVAIENLRFDGRVMKSPEEAAIRVGPFVQDFRMDAP